MNMRKVRKKLEKTSRKYEKMNKKCIKGESDYEYIKIQPYLAKRGYYVREVKMVDTLKSRYKAARVELKSNLGYCSMQGDDR